MELAGLGLVVLAGTAMLFLLFLTLFCGETLKKIIKVVSKMFAMLLGEGGETKG